MVDQVFPQYHLEECEIIQVFIKKLRDYILEWWEKYKHRKKRRQKENIKTLNTSNGELMDAFYPSIYLYKHLYLPLVEINLTYLLKASFSKRGVP